MARKIKPLIYVFWKGESEQAYARYLKKTFEDVAIIKPYNGKGLFSTAVDTFNNSPRYTNSKDATDEI